MIATYYNYEDLNYEVYNGKKTTVKSKLPKSEVYLTDALPKKDLPTLLENSTIWKCSSNALEKFQEGQKIEGKAEAIWEYYQAIPNAFRQAKLDPPIAAYYTIFKEYQAMRMAAANRLLHDNSDTLKEFMKTMESGEDQLRKIVTEEAEKQPIYSEWLLKVKGIGPILAAGLVVTLGDVTRFNYRSGLYAYCGYAVDDTGGIQKDTKGQQSAWNHNVKPLMFVLVGNLMKAHSPVYSDLYYQEKEKQMAVLDNKNHAHKRAIRRVAKLFLSHFWQVSRELAGLPTNSPYIIAHSEGKHNVLIEPPNWHGKNTLIGG